MITRADTICHLFWQSQVPDTNGDGIGDAEGAMRILPLLKEMGFAAAWLAPFVERGSEGYDIKDYLAPAADWGTLAQTRELVRRARGLGLGLLCDFVPPHTSDEHPMFVEALRNPESPFRDWYYFVSGSPNIPPTGTCSVFRDTAGSAWTWRETARNRDGSSGMWTFNLFLPCHPALNFHNPAVVDFMIRTIKYWADVGFCGARIDSARHIRLHRELTTRDESLMWPERPFPWDRWQHDLTSNAIDDETGENLSATALRDILAGVRRVAPDFFAVAENVSLSRAEQRAYAAAGAAVLDYGLADPDTGIGFVRRDANQIRATLEALHRYAGEGVAFVPFNANHDAFPFAVTDEQWVGNSHHPEPRGVRAVLTLILTCPSGGPAILYGPPLGAGLVEDNGRDVMGRAANRGVTRWDDTEGGGFTRPGVPLYWPATPPVTSVARQLADPDSLLTFARALMRIRRATGTAPSFTLLDGGPGVVSYDIGDYRITLNVDDVVRRVEPEVLAGAGREVYCCDGYESVRRGELDPLAVVIAGPGLRDFSLTSLG